MGVAIVAPNEAQGSASSGVAVTDSRFWKLSKRIVELAPENP